jgi:hypothetical protein
MLHRGPVQILGQHVCSQDYYRAFQWRKPPEEDGLVIEITIRVLSECSAVEITEVLEQVGEGSGEVTN